MLSFLPKKHEDVVEKIWKHFIQVFPDIPIKDLYIRILNGYCWGEGKGVPIINIEDWEKVLYNKEGRELFSECASWTDYENVNKDNWYKNGLWFKFELSGIDKDYHLHLVQQCIFIQFLYSMSFRSRIEFDLHLVCIYVPSYDKELDTLSDDELNEKLQALKAPWWENMYSEVKKNPKLLEILHRRGCKLEDLETIYKAQQRKDTKTINYMYRHPSKCFILSYILSIFDKMLSTSFFKSLVFIILLLLFFGCLILCIFESIKL